MMMHARRAACQRGSYRDFSPPRATAACRAMADSEGVEKEQHQPAFKTWQDYAKNVAMGSVVFASLWAFSVASTSWPGFGESPFR